MISRVILKIHGDFYKRLDTYILNMIIALKLALEEYID